jgi:hypothetical protein
MPINSSVFPALSCTSFKVSGLMLRSLIHLELIVVQSKCHGSSFTFLHADIQFSQQYLLKRLSFFSIMDFRCLCQNQVGIAAWIHIWVFYSSLVLVVISPFLFLILLIWVFSLFILVRYAKGLSILFIFSKNQFFVLLILCRVTLLSISLSLAHILFLFFC